MAEAKRRFADVLGAVVHRGERYVIERNGTPMAALVPLSTPNLATWVAHAAPSGFLALVGALNDGPLLSVALWSEATNRHEQQSRPLPSLN